MAAHRGSGRRKSRRPERPRTAGSGRIRNGKRGTGSTVDNELHVGADRHPLSQAPEAGDLDWRYVGYLSRLSGFEGVHLTVRPDLDQGHGKPAGVIFWK